VFTRTIKATQMSKKKSAFTRFAQATASFTGHPVCFASAAGIIVFWAVSGPLFHFSDTWQLIINTGTTIVTFLMVFLIQNTQNRDSEAMQIKLDDIIRALDQTNKALLDLEELDEQQLDRIRKRYLKLAEQARAQGESAEHP